MAKKEATLTLKIKTKGKKLIDNVAKSTKELGKATAKIGAVLVASYAAVSAAIVKFGQKGVKFKGIQDAFKSLAANQGQDANVMLANMKKLSAGTVSELELMKQANNALLLGLPVDKFGDMVKIARGAAAATGESMEHMLSSITTGLGRQSKLVLDNLGIVFDLNKAYEEHAQKIGVSAGELLDFEKKQAFVNKALEIGNDNLKNQGGVQDSAADKWKAIKITMVDTANKLSVLMIPALEELVRSTKPMIDKFSELSNHPFVTKGAVLFTKVFAGINVGIEGVTKTIVAKLMPTFEAIPELVKGNFIKAFEIMTKDTKTISQIVEEQKVELNKRLAAVDADFAALNDQKRQEELDKIKANSAEILQQKAIDKQIEKELTEISNEEKKERERLFKEAMKDESLQIQMDEINQALKNEKDRDKALTLIRKKMKLKNDAINAQEKKSLIKRSEFDKFINHEKVKGFQSSLNQISTLQNANSKKLVILGKAAAIASITISTSVAAVEALRWGLMYGGPAGPALGKGMAGLVVAAGAVSAAQVAGVQLAEGGIVRATPGGIQATIGEGGRDEAVIPLDDDGASDRLGGGNTFNFNGPVMGDKAQAREFAVAIDQELTTLRRDGESLAFDTDIA